MWMMGCSSGVSESFSRKVRPHLPRPSNIISPPPYLSRLHSIHGGDHLLLNHHHLVSVEQSKRDYDEPALVSSRWNPTPEQLQTLEELYRRGTRTPSADQIQHITAQLRRYGKIEGKNVFYWFQNHKARERMKRRRRSEDNTEDQQLESPHTQNSDNKEQDASRTSCEAEQTSKNNYWDFSSITPTTPTEEESVSMQNAEKSGGIHFDHQVQENTRFMNRYPTWQMMPSSSTSSSSSTRPIFTVMAEDLNLLITTKNQQESQHTLELFPLQKGDKNGENNMDYKDKGLVSNEDMNSNGSAPKQFFEFL